MLWTVLLEKTLENSLDFKEIKPVNPKGNQAWIFIGSTDAESEAPILWPFDVKSQLTGKDPDAEKDWTQEEKGTTEDEMVGWHHRLDGHEFEQAPGVGDGQGSLVCWSPWGHRVWHDLATEFSCFQWTVWSWTRQSRSEFPNVGKISWIFYFNTYSMYGLPIIYQEWMKQPKLF